MRAAGDSDFSATSRPAARRPIGVHVLSEHVFCPRAAVLAYESGPDSGDEEPNLGPNLTVYTDYDERGFAEAIHEQWGKMRLWLTLMAPALMVVLLVWYIFSLLVAAVVSLPVFLLLAKCWESLLEIIRLVRERAISRAAPVMTIDLAPTEVKRLNWWSLRKSGFDCVRLVDPLTSPQGELKGKPWRMLRKGNTIGIPVIRRRRGIQDWGPQHELRLAMYCRLIEQREGRASPFGVILFAGKYDCVIIPNSPDRQTRGERALDEVREFMEIQERGTHHPVAPTDRRCAGCPHGLPQLIRRARNKSERDVFQSLCGNRFGWIPPHRDAIALGIAKEA
jgi:hypothetical protein